MSSRSSSFGRTLGSRFQLLTFLTSFFTLEMKRGTSMPILFELDSPISSLSPRTRIVRTFPSIKLIRFCVTKKSQLSLCSPERLLLLWTLLSGGLRHWGQRLLTSPSIRSLKARDSTALWRSRRRKKDLFMFTTQHKRNWWTSKANSQCQKCRRTSPTQESSSFCRRKRIMNPLTWTKTLL